MIFQRVSSIDHPNVGAIDTDVIDEVDQRPVTNIEFSQWQPQTVGVLDPFLQRNSSRVEDFILDDPFADGWITTFTGE